MTVDVDQHCPVCSSTHIYWTFSTVDADVWDCGSCGYQWAVKVAEIIKNRDVATG